MSADLFDVSQPPTPSDVPMDVHTFRAGMLMETAAAHQQIAEAALKRLDAAMRALEPSVRDAVEQVVAQVVAETAKAVFAQLRSEVQSTSQTMRSVRSGMTWNLGLLACAMAAIATGTAVGGVYVFGGFTGARQATPAAPNVFKGDAALLADLARQGLVVDISLCGDARRPCVKVDPKAGSFGPRKDRMVLPMTAPPSPAR